jgi:dephospho-CoA kinase|uniref:Dephospho-CoA kinase n=1 Tax=Desulfobacca acetoxidans TaxID=60893 RepID=A0A7C3ZAZ0_9BACT
MLKIALTGGPGSGKSTVARMFRELGAEVIDADEVAHAVVARGTPAWKELRREFGPEYFQEDGSLHRPRMAELVFRDAEARRKLNAIVHPRVTREISRRLADLAARGVNLVLVEVPLLFEAGLEKNFDRVIVVDADTEAQLARLTARDGRTAGEARGILAAQWPLKDKKARADFVVNNRGCLSDTRKQVKELWHKLKMMQNTA